jgi:exopolysaccharide biosynthesis polyprenyl glycosylphosphotransferase
VSTATAATTATGDEPTPGYASAGPAAVDLRVAPAARRAFRPRTQWALARFSIDATMLGLGVALAETGWRAAGFAPTPVVWVLLFPLVAVGLLYAGGAYGMRLRPRFLDEARRAVIATTVATMAVTTARVVVSDHTIPSAQTVRPWLFATACLLAGRAVLGWGDARARVRGEGARPTLVLGAGTVGRLLAQRLLDRPELGLRPVGFLDREPRETLDGVPVLGASWDLDRVVEEHGVEMVLVTFSTAPHDVLLRLARRCDELGVEVAFVPRLFERVPERISVDHVGGIPLVTPRPANPRGWQFALKYAFDRAAAAILLLLLLPVMAAISVAVLLAMGRPVLFRQARVGLDGREFGILKFRTMRGRPEDGGELDEEWAARQLGDEAAERATAEDRRTPLGRLLRKASLDELPQLLNVLSGEMSLVGPRPERAHYARRFEDSISRYAERHRVKSGITGWAQVNGLRGATSLTDRVEWDNFYIENWSLWLDVQILLRTPAALLTRRGE